MNAVRERIKDVHPSDPRFTQARAWRAAVEGAGDPFERFFFGYLALVIAARTGPTGEAVPEESAVKRLIEDLEDEIPSLIGMCREQLLWFAQRDLPSGQMMLDLPGPPSGDTEYFWSLRDYVSLGHPVPTWKVAKGVGRLIIRIRNNLFHGAKDYSASRDRDVLEHINPLVLALVDVFLRDAPGGS